MRTAFKFIISVVIVVTEISCNGNTIFNSRSGGIRYSDPKNTDYDSDDGTSNTGIETLFQDVKKISVIGMVESALRNENNDDLDLNGHIICSPRNFILHHESNLRLFAEKFSNLGEWFESCDIHSEEDLDYGKIERGYELMAKASCDFTREKSGIEDLLPDNSFLLIPPLDAPGAQPNPQVVAAVAAANQPQVPFAQQNHHQQLGGHQNLAGLAAQAVGGPGQN